MSGGRVRSVWWEALAKEFAKRAGDLEYLRQLTLDRFLEPVAVKLGDWLKHGSEEKKELAEVLAYIVFAILKLDHLLEELCLGDLRSVVSGDDP